MRCVGMRIPPASAALATDWILLVVQLFLILYGVQTYICQYLNDSLSL